MLKSKKPLYSENDFLESCLPRDREQQFKFIFKTRKPLLFKLGLLSLAFSIFFIVAMFLKGTFSYNSYQIFVEGGMGEEDYLSYYVTNNTLFMLIACGCFFIYTFFIAGLFNIFKKLVFAKPVYFWRDFKDGIKENIGSFLLLSLFINIFIALLTLLYYLYGYFFLLIIFIVLFILFILPYLLDLFFYKSIYKAGFKETIKNGFKLFLITNFKCVGLTLLFLVIPGVAIVFMDLIQITSSLCAIILAIYFIFFIPIYLLWVYEYFASIFDECVNKINFPNYYRKGLYNIDIDNPRKDLKDENTI